MAVLSKDEFVAATQTTDAGTLDPDREAWAGRAASVVAVAALSHDNFSKDDIVEALQALALRMPGELVAEATMRMMYVNEQSNI